MDFGHQEEVHFPDILHVGLTHLRSTLHLPIFLDCLALRSGCILSWTSCNVNMIAFVIFAAVLIKCC
jgi:hypothetical protein